VSTISTAQSDCASLKEALAALQAGQESYAQFVADLLAELEATQNKLRQAEAQIDQQNHELADLRNQQTAALQQAAESERSGDQALLNKVAELESDRQALEEELENIRTRAVDMAQTIADQKRQMSEDQTQWMGEFQQLRRILDKQTKWIKEQTGRADGAGRSAPASVERAFDLDLDVVGESAPAVPAGGAPTASPGLATPQRAGANPSDPVIGSVLSQFEFLQKDVARRRKQGGTERTAKKASPPEKLNNG
jgi:SMC interacting uncharacterized protein involved in chromosome segregation